MHISSRTSITVRFSSGKNCITDIVKRFKIQYVTAVCKNSLTPTAGVLSSNAAKTRNRLKFVGVSQIPEPISAASGPKFIILCGMWRRYCCLTFFPIVDTCLSCEYRPIARQSCAMMHRCRFFCILYFQPAACSTFQTCILNSH